MHLNAEFYHPVFGGQIESNEPQSHISMQSHNFLQTLKKIRIINSQTTEENTTQPGREIQHVVFLNQTSTSCNAIILGSIQLNSNCLVTI